MLAQNAEVFRNRIDKMKNADLNTYGAPTIGTLEKTQSNLIRMVRNK